MILSNKRVYQAQLAQNFQNLVIGQSTRQGGVSPSPFTSLNLGLHTSDAIEHVTENRRLFFADLGISTSQIAGAHQVHGTKIKIVDQPGQWEGYDAFVTDQVDLFLTVTIADCVPVLVVDPQRKITAAAHAGWKGTVGQIAKLSVEAMSEHFDSNPQDCYAFIGACIDECSFEVDTDVANHFPSDHKRWDEDKAKFFVDLKTANQHQLITAGIPISQIEISPHCTVLNNDWYFSHRKERGNTGRGLAVIGWRGQH